MKTVIKLSIAFRIAVLGGGLGLGACAAQPPQLGQCQNLHSGNFVGLFNYANVSNDTDCGERLAASGVYKTAIEHGQPATAAGALRRLNAQDEQLRTQMEQSVRDTVDQLNHPQMLGCDVAAVPGDKNQVSLTNCNLVTVAAPKPPEGPKAP